MKTYAIIPAYMEEATIRNVVEKTKKHVDKVFVVDDGSTDNTGNNAREAGAIVVKHRQNAGYGAAIRTCFLTARKYDADIMVILDADDQHNPDDIPLFIDSITNKGFDVVIGSRFLKNSSKMPLYRTFGMRVLNLLTNFDGGGNYDSQSGFRAYSKKAIHLIEPRENGMGASSEIIIKAQKRGLKIGEVPITVRYDTRPPSQHPLRHGAAVIVAIIKLIGEKHPLRFFGATGLGMLTLGLYLGYQVMNQYNQIHLLPTGTALITVILILGGIFLMTMGMLMFILQDTIRRELQEYENQKRLMDLTTDELQ